MTDTDQPPTPPNAPAPQTPPPMPAHGPVDEENDGDCKPMNLDFDRIAAIVTGERLSHGGPRTLRTVEHGISHLREETGLGDRQIARVLMTAACLLGDLVQRGGPKWDGIVTTNWLSSCAARLWDEDEPA